MSANDKTLFLPPCQETLWGQFAVMAIGLAGLWRAQLEPVVLLPLGIALGAIGYLAFFTKVVQSSSQVRLAKTLLGVPSKLVVLAEPGDIWVETNEIVTGLVARSQDGSMVILGTWMGRRALAKLSEKFPIRDPEAETDDRSSEETST